MNDPPDRRDDDDPPRRSPEARSHRASARPSRPARPARPRRGRIGRGAADVHAFFTRELWSRELASLPTFRRWWYSLARVVQLTGVNFVKDRCTWRASALTYITVLSLVPMLALAFSVAKGMGAYQTLLDETITPFLDSTFGPAPVDEFEVAVRGEEALGEELDEGLDDLVEGEDGEGPPPVEDPVEPEPASEEQGDETAAPVEGPDGVAATTPTEEATAEVSEIRRVIDTVLAFVQNTNVGSLGAFGFLIVLWTVIKLLGAVEHSFNDIWGVQKARSLPRKLADYFSTVVLVPLLLVVGTGVLGMARSESVGRVIGLGGDSPVVALLGSLAVVWLAFAVAFVVMPNTKVRVSSALVGGVVGGTMWHLFQWAHLKLQVGVANYNAIYSTFAALPIFLFWVQSSWMTVLLGAEAASAHQNQASHGQIVRSRDYDLALKEIVALRLAVRVTRAFLSGAPPTPTEHLASELGCPERTLLAEGARS